MEFRCPICHVLISSRKPRICGNCGVVLPPALLLTEEQVRARDDQRQWARQLANAFGGKGPIAEGSGQPSSAGRSSVQHGSSASEALRRGTDFAVEFRCRKRKGFWLYVVGYSLMLIPLSLISAVLGRIPFWAWLPMIGVVALFCCSAWWRAAPVCPNCHQDIRICPATYCHLCGEPLNDGRCPHCGVDHAWTGWFRPFDNGLARCIAHCPGCGVQIDSWVRRWRGDRW